MDQKRIAESGSRLHSYGDSKTEEFLKSEAGRSLLKLIRDDNKSHFLTEAKRIFENDSDALDRSTVSKLLRLCCASDSVDCASALLNGDLAIVPPVNEMDESGRSALHIAADKHAARCIELLLQNHARTDLKTIDERAQLALDLSLSSNRMDVKWAPDKNSVEDLVVALSGKEWSAVRFLVENTKELSEVAYANAVKGCVVGLAALLIVAENKVKELTVELHDANSGAKEKMTLYEFIISKALSLAHATTPSTMARHSSSTEAESENAEIRKLSLCEIKLLQLFGADVPTSSTVMRMTLPLIRAVQVIKG
ncbi:Ankyrin repeat family protein [Quillaja saponaria]|uniref:Ankyrin repeat family protein n=1 Tax=Quillaja saponaria TaxID=32244 RepID=A0AAD7VC83_QUISA|nr:Ankyrin repeat family protein [Quillaja saponaria]